MNEEPPTADAPVVIEVHDRVSPPDRDHGPIPRPGDGAAAPLGGPLFNAPPA